MTRFQSKLPGVTVHQLRRRMLASLIGAVDSGFWYCLDGEHICERMEGENGQPAHCSQCGSHRIEWNRPATQV
jgi:hypothetical protein